MRHNSAAECGYFIGSFIVVSLARPLRVAQLPAKSVPFDVPLSPNFALIQQLYICPSNLYVADRTGMPRPIPSFGFRHCTNPA